MAVERIPGSPGILENMPGRDAWEAADYDYDPVSINEMTYTVRK